jgi:hypothetical protein
MSTPTFTAVATDSVTGLTGTGSASFDVAAAPQPTPPGTGTVAKLIGARGGPSNALANFTTADSTIGPLNCTKLFYSGSLPATFTNGTEAKLPSGVIPVVCYKTMDTNVAAYVKSVTRDLWLVYHQEPEGDYSQGATFVSEFTRQSALIRAQGNSHVKVVNCAGGYPYRSAGSSDVLSGNYIPPASSLDYYCKDVYQDPAARWPSAGLSNYDEWLNWLKLVQGLGKPLGVTEYGIGLSGGAAKRNSRIQQDCAYLRTVGIEMWQYWWVNMGSTATNYQFTDAATVDTWKKICAGTI